MPDAAPAGSTRMPLLDGMRGIAAICVVLFHAHLPIVGKAFSQADTSVDLFFLLSGFVIAHSFEERFRSGLGVEAFVRLRVRRFLPLVALGSLFGGIAAMADTPPVTLAITVLCSALLIPALRSTTLYPVNPPQWSLFYELLANAVHALLLHRLGTRQLALLAALFAATYLACYVQPRDPAIDREMVGLSLLQWARAMWSYTVGVICLRLWKEGRSSFSIDWRLALIAPFVIIIVLPYLDVLKDARQAVVVIAVFPALFWFAIHARTPAWAGPGLCALGAISFPLYAIHFPILRASVLLVGEQGAALGFVVALVAAIGLCCLQAVLKPMPFFTHAKA